MEWVQFVTLMATVIGAAFAFYKMTQDRIDRLEEYRRDDLRRIDERLLSMDERWESVLDRIALKDVVV